MLYYGSEVLILAGILIEGIAKTTPMEEKNVLSRITLNPEVCRGRASFRNMRFTVARMLELLAAGMSSEEILEDYPYVEKEDIEAGLVYTALIVDPPSGRLFLSYMKQGII